MIKKIAICAALALALSVNAFAMEVPNDTTVQNLNGSQQVIKTYTVNPALDPKDLIDEPFELEGYRYTFSDITKVENHVEDRKYHTETVTVETDKKDLAVILEQLAPTLEYSNGSYSGTLALDHTSIRTEATGYSTKSYTVTETKTIGQLDRNDMTYVPSTTVKNGVTLNLANVDWQVTGTELVGEALTPSSYQAVATYSGKTYYKAANGYVTTVDYVGEIERDGLESITYQVTYLGEAVSPSGAFSGALQKLSVSWAYILCGLLLLALVVLAVLLVRSRREIGQLQEEDGEEDDLPDESEQEESK